MKTYTLYLALCTTLLITACDGNDASFTTHNLITLNITDAPVDEADAVIVEFSGVTLKAANGNDRSFDFDPPKSINLLALQGTQSQPLLENVEIPAGQYTQIRLAVNAEFDSVMDSYITVNSVDYELRVPSGSQSGLKLNTPFTVATGTAGMSVANNNAIYTIDFDLRKSIVKPNGQPGYFLKPVLRLIQNVNTGSISGTINDALLVGANCSDADPLSGNAIYVFNNADTLPDDVDEMGAEPLTTALVNFNSETGIYSYEVGFLPEGSYTLAFTCAADLDNELDNANVVFDAVENVTVTAGNHTELSL